MIWIQNILFVFRLIIIWIWLFRYFSLVIYTLLAWNRFGCTYLLLLVLFLGLNLFFSSLILTGFVLTPWLFDQFICLWVHASFLYLFELLYLAVVRFFPFQISAFLWLCMIIGGVLVRAIWMTWFFPHWRCLTIWPPYCILRFNWWIQIIVITELAY